jgi:uncharacterized protein (DUF362 family)
MMWRCKNCDKKWAYPVDKCIFCGQGVESTISSKLTVRGITQVFVPSTDHKKIPYYNLLLEDEDGNLQIKKTFKKFNLGQRYDEAIAATGTVVAVSSVGYSVTEATKRALMLIGGIKVKPIDKILIKPNIVLAKSASTGIVTNPLVVEGIIQYLLQIGAHKNNIVIAEGCLEGVDAAKAIKKAGYLDICLKYGVHFSNLMQGKFVKKEIHKGISVQIAEEVFTSNLIINVPVIKTHFQTGVSLGLKNMKGAINHQSRKTMHQSDLELLVARLNKVLPEYITVADGTVGLEGMGPAGLGDPANLGLIVAGKDPVAVDTAICHITQLKVPRHITEAARLGIGEGDMNKITIIGEEIAVVHKKFQPATGRLSPHPNIELLDGKPCSGCLNSVWSSLHSIREFPAEALSVAFGSQLDEETVSGYGKIVAIGDCAFRALKQKGHEIEALKGCPPGESEQIEFLRRWLKK